MPPARWFLLVPLLLVTACRPEPSRPQTKEVVVWRQVGSWSGRGDKQTETFTSDTGGFRVHWDTKHEAPPDAGRLRVVFRSGDSGREIIEAIDARGAGSGTEESAERACEKVHVLPQRTQRWPRESRVSLCGLGGLRG